MLGDIIPGDGGKHCQCEVTPGSSIARSFLKPVAGYRPFLAEPCWLLIAFGSEPWSGSGWSSHRGTKFYWQLNPMLMPTQLAESTGSRPAHAALARKLLWLLEAIPHTCSSSFFWKPLKWQWAGSIYMHLSWKPRIFGGKQPVTKSPWEISTYWLEEFHYGCAEMLQSSSLYFSMMFMCILSRSSLLMPFGPWPVM